MSLWLISLALATPDVSVPAECPSAADLDELQPYRAEVLGVDLEDFIDGTALDLIDDYGESGCPVCETEDLGMDDTITTCVGSCTTSAGSRFGGTLVEEFDADWDVYTRRTDWTWTDWEFSPAPALGLSWDSLSIDGIRRRTSGDYGSPSPNVDAAMVRTASDPEWAFDLQVYYKLADTTDGVEYDQFASLTASSGTCTWTSDVDSMETSGVHTFDESLTWDGRLVEVHWVEWDTRDCQARQGATWLDGVVWTGPSWESDGGASDVTGWTDEDQDGWAAADDCDDTDATAFPCATEVEHDGIDQDCDGEDIWDDDGDGYNIDTYGGTDCDDQDAAVNPGAAEVWYDGVDQDCDGASDHDADADGHDSTVSGGDDCDDGDAQVHPGQWEVWYDGVDQDCDGASDNDADGDGHDADHAGGGDCDDQDPEVHPDALEVWYDGVDQDCDGASDFDADGDGHDADFAGGDDCDDEDADIVPAADGECGPSGPSSASQEDEERGCSSGSAGALMVLLLPGLCGCTVRRATHTHPRAARLSRSGPGPAPA